MVIVLAIIATIMTITTICLVVRWVLFRQALMQITQRLDFVLDNETNIGIDLSLSDKTLIALAATLNKNLTKLKIIKTDYRKKDAELRESITNISHDLRTPLTVINSYIDLIERSHSNLSDKTRTSLTVIKDRATAMYTLIEELQNYSMLEMNQLPLEMTDVCLNNALEKNLTEFYTAITERGIVPQIIICQDNIVRKINSNAIDRIISNILSNVVKYSDGDLCVELKSSGELIFTNTAKNIDTISVGKLFDRFFTVENARLSTGLGLAIAKTLTIQLGGEITAELIDQKLVLRLVFR